MRKKYKTEIGLSDHTKGLSASFAAVALGATVIEKHLMLDKKFKTVDSDFSIDPLELKDLVKNSAEIWKSLGKEYLKPTQMEKKSMRLKRSIYVSKDIIKGDKISSNNIKIIRPSGGLSPKHYGGVIGKKAVTNLKIGTPLKKNHIK